MAFKMKGFSGPFKQESTISNKEAKGINIENISAVQNKNGKNFVVEVDEGEYYDPGAKNSIGGLDDKWDSNYNDTNNKRDTILVNSSYNVGDLIDETEWEEGEATNRVKKKSPMKQGVIRPMPKDWKGTIEEWKNQQGLINKKWVEKINARRDSTREQGYHYPVSAEKIKKEKSEK